MKQLEDTTMKTFLQWFPDGQAGTLKLAKHNFMLGHDARGNINKFAGPPTKEFPKGTWVAAEIRFRALDRPEQAKDLLSQEFTGIFFNEFREINNEIFEAASGRVGRGLPATWSGMFGDSNPFLPGSSWDKVFSEPPSQMVIDACAEIGVPVPAYELYSQPGGMDANAENIENLPGGKLYYINMLASAEKGGKSESWINRHIHGKRVFVSDGKGIYTKDFNERTHIPPINLDVMPNVPIGIGLDFGVSPAAVFGQMLPSGRWQILGELEGDGGGAEAFGHDIRSYFRDRGWENQCFIIGDPAGNQRSQADAKTPIDVLRAQGFNIRACKYQAISVRLDSVRMVMRRMLDGQAAFLVDRGCSKLIQGFSGGYEYRRMQTSEERYSDTPNKNEYSHLQDALQYLVSEFEGQAIKGGRTRAFPDDATIDGTAQRRRGPQQPANSGWSSLRGGKSHRGKLRAGQPRGMM
jgi:hypothetical protein